MLNYYIKEFIGICTYLEKSGAKKIKRYFVVDKSVIGKLLAKNKYEDPQKKLSVWKSLNWIDAEENRMTKIVYDQETGRNKRYVKIDVTVYEMLKQLSEADI